MFGVISLSFSLSLSVSLSQFVATHNLLVTLFLNEFVLIYFHIVK